MSLTISDYINHVKTSKSFHPICKVEMLDRDEHIISNYVFDGWRIISGSLTVSQNNGVRRSCSLTLNNYDHYLDPSPDIIWINQKFALYLGFKINGEDFFIKQGVFVMDDPVMDKSGTVPVLKITSQDKWALLNGDLGGNLDATYIIPIGSSPNTALSTLLTVSAIDDPQGLIADATTEVTPYLSQTDIENSYADVALDLTTMLARNIYFDKSGHLNYRDDIDDSLKPSLFDFNDGNTVQYLGGAQTFVYKNAYNIVRVIGNNINGHQASATVRNENSASPLAIERIGEKAMKPIKDNLISTDTLALYRAQYELKQASRLYSSVKFNCYPLYHLDVDNICRVTDPKINLDNERLLINGYTINFGRSNSMSIDATKVQELLFSFS